MQRGIQHRRPQHQQPRQQQAQRAQGAMASVAPEQAERAQQGGEGDEAELQAVVQPHCQAQRRQGRDQQRQQRAVGRAGERACGAEAIEPALAMGWGHDERWLTAAAAVERNNITSPDLPASPPMPNPRTLQRLPVSILRASILLALSATALAAQDDPRHDEIKDLDDIVVRATPLPRTAEDLTRPVEVLAGSRLDEVRAVSLGET